MFTVYFSTGQITEYRFETALVFINYDGHVLTLNFLNMYQGKEVLTVLAYDEDDSRTNNGTFVFTIKSVTPKTDNVEFYIQQQKESGKIYFKGCLDYEV